MAESVLTTAPEATPEPAAGPGAFGTAATARSGAVVVRVAGVPADVLAALRFGRTMPIVDRLRSTGRWLRGAAGPLSDRLHEAIGREPDRTTRAGLIALRRDVFNARTPRRWPDALPDGLAGALAEWHDRARERDALAAAGRSAYAADAARVVDALRHAATDEWFRRGVATASPDFIADLMRHEQDPAGRDAAMPARLATTLYKYVTRAAAKTSPYSTFTSSALGEWTADGAAASATGPVERVGVVELDVALAAQVVAALVRHPERRAGLLVRANPGVRTGDGTLLVLANSAWAGAAWSGSATSGAAWAGSATSGAALRPSPGGGERLRELRPAPGVDALLEHLRGRGAVPWPEVVALVGSAPVVGRLVEAGLLELVAPVADQSSDHLADLRRLLADGPAALAAPVARLADGLRRIGATAAVSQRLDARGEVAAAVGRLSDVCGSTHPYRGSGWYEDTVLPSPRFRFGAAGWAGVLDALAALRAVAGLFDYAQPARRAAVRAFLRRHGEAGRVSFLRFCAEAVGDLDEVLRRPRAVPATYPRGFADVAPLLRELTGLVAGYPVIDGERRVPAGRLRDFAAGLPAWARSPRSLAFLGHPVVSADGRATFVLNSVEGGYGRAAARVRRRLGLGPAGWTVPSEPSTVYAEVVAHSGNNVNLRSGRAPFEIAYPGVTSPRPRAELIDLGELDVAYDGVAQRLVLRSPRLGRRVVPVHLGGMAEFLLAPAHRLLVGVFGDTPWCYLAEGLAPVDEVRTDIGNVYWRRRLRVGDVVVQRATLVVPSERLPARERDLRQGWVGASDAARRPSQGAGLDHLVRVTEWREALGLGERCFVRTLPTNPDIRNLGWNDKRRKPLYLDLTSDLALGLLDQIARTPGRTAFLQEVLPEFDQTWVRLEGRPHVAECVVDVW